jgi:hypothetical protein
MKFLLLAIVVIVVAVQADFDIIEYYWGKLDDATCQLVNRYQHRFEHKLAPAHAYKELIKDKMAPIAKSLREKVFFPLLEKVINPLNDKLMGRGYKSIVQLKIEEAAKNRLKIREEN